MPTSSVAHLFPRVFDPLYLDRAWWQPEIGTVKRLIERIILLQIVNYQLSLWSAYDVRCLCARRGNNPTRSSRRLTSLSDIDWPPPTWAANCRSQDCRPDASKPR